MDKLIIVIGGGLVWAAATDNVDKTIDNTRILFNKPGFIGVMIIYAVLFTFAKQVKPLAWIPANLAVLIALGLWSKIGVKK